MKRLVKLATVVACFAIPTPSALAVEALGCPHDVGKGKFKPRLNIKYTEAEKAYSDEVWKALRGSSPYAKNYDEMVGLPYGWHQRLTQISLGLEYGIVDRLSVGVFLPYVTKDVKRQAWSKTANKAVWTEVEDDGLDDMWFAVKYQVYSRPPVWEEGGIFVAAGYKPSITSDGKIRSGIGSGTHDFMVAALAHPYFTENFFLCSDAWYHQRGEVKTVQGFSKSGWELGDRFGYRAFLGYEFSDHRFALIAGPVGWIGRSNEDGNGQRIEDSDTYSHAVVMKFRWQPLGDEELGSIDIGVRIPYVSKTLFAPAFIPFIGARIKF